MPIPEQELNRSFIAVDGTLTVAELREQVRSKQAAVDYLIMILPHGGYIATLLSEVSRVVYRLGPAALDLSLAQLPLAAEATGAVQRMAMGFGAAARERDRQPQRRLIVLEGEQPVGLLTNEARGSSSGGLPFDLFGRYREQSREELQRILAARHDAMPCPRCGSPFTFYALRPEIGAYACPHCHSVLATG